MYGIFVCATVGQSLWKINGHNGLEGLGVALAAYFVTTPWMGVIPQAEGSVRAFGWISYTNFGAEAILTVMIVALVSVEMLHQFSKLKALTIKMPSYVPPAVGESFSKLLPSMLTIVIFALLAYILSANLDGQTLKGLIMSVVAVPLKALTNNVVAAFFIPFFVALFFFFGVHGGTIVGPIVSTVLSPAGFANLEMYAQGVTDWSQYNVLTFQFLNSFVYMGGGACAFGLLVALYIYKRRKNKVLLAVATGPVTFNINEPLVYGLPVVLDPYLLFPFVFSSSVISVFSYIMIDIGLVHPVVASVPWTTPPILSGWLATGMHWSGAVLSIVNIAIVVLMYLPFLKLRDMNEEKSLYKTQNGEN